MTDPPRADPTVVAQVITRVNNYVHTMRRASAAAACPRRTIRNTYPPRSTSPRHPQR